MDVVKSESDLEDGEIREEVLEDVSDCSLSDIIQEDFSDDINGDSLGNETLNSLQIDESNNEAEKFRLEALKSLLENTGFMNMNEKTLQDIEDLTEEEKLRVEAVKSLMRNINFLTTKKTSTSVVNGAKKCKKRRKKKNLGSPQKRVKVEEEPIEETKSDKTYLEETTSLLSELSGDVKKINESIEHNKVVKNTETNLVNKDISTENDSVDKSQTVINSARLWYPKSEFTMIDILPKRNVVIKRDKCNGSRGVRNQSNNSGSQKPGNGITTNPSRKTEVFSECLELINTEISTKPDRLPKKECDEITNAVNVEPRDNSEQSMESKTLEKPENKRIFNQTTQRNCDFQTKTKLKKTTYKIINPRVIINSPKSKSISAKINAACSFRKFNSTQPVPNNQTLYSMTRKSSRYKLNNVTALNSKYTLKKTNLKIDKTKSEQNKPTNSRYSINRTNQYSKVNLKEFIIPLNDDDREDSSKEEDLLAKPAMPLKLPEPQVEVTNSMKNHIPKQYPEPVEIKQEPQEVPEELPNDDFASTESPSTTTADTSTVVKEEPMSDVFDEPFNVADIEILQVSSLRCDTSPSLPPQDHPPLLNVEPEPKSEVNLLFEAEENLVEIRSKLLSSLGELDTSIKTNAQEKEKLLDMVKKLNSLKALVVKFEDKIKTQKMKLTMSNSFTQSLYEGVMLRSKTCEKMRDLCAMAGKKIIGPSYRPPEDYVVELEEKQKTLDFSKYVQKTTEKK